MNRNRTDADTTHKLTIAYDGTPFRGWQIQGAEPTIQLALEQAVAKCWGRPISVHGSGRTDTGVHALGQVAHFRAPRKLPKESLLPALNNNLPPTIRILRATFAPSDFHARFCATGKEYIYRIVNQPIMPPFEINRACHIPRPLDLMAMRAAAAFLVGEHDFASFTSNPGYERETTVRTIHSIKISRQAALLTFRFHGNGFLYRMVRNIMGALIKVGHGRLVPFDLSHILASRTRSNAPQTAPACGLYLAKVFYK